jgi:2-polyprenyl-3-methyl-5-hydroxy-6-metoxy-1,4-benzoquinol methylase
VTLDSGFVKIDTTEPLPDNPNFKGQIGDPSSRHLEIFRSLYSPVIDNSKLDKSALRVLEVGAGIGRCSRSFLTEYSPKLYIASEPFSSLATTLRANLNQWGYRWPSGVAALYNANNKSLLGGGSVNVVIGNSVLHHILEYEQALSHWCDLLDSPGIMMFGEPIKEVAILDISCEVCCPGIECGRLVVVKTHNRHTYSSRYNNVPAVAE